MDWSSIISQLKRGNNQALKTFYENHAGYCVHRLMKGNKCSREDAEDIFIEAIMNLRDRLITGKLKNVLNVRSYLYGTCYHMFLSRLDQSNRQNRHTRDIEQYFYNSVYTDEGSEYRDEMLAVASKAWSTLTDRCKDIINYFYIERLRMEEIAELMGLSNGNVAKNTKLRCYKKLVANAREMMADQQNPMVK